MLSLQEHIYDYALLPYPAGSKLDLDSLLDFADYLHSKQKKTTTDCDSAVVLEKDLLLLTLVEWLSHARHLLGLDEDVARVYYETYVMLRKPAPHQPQGEEPDVCPPLTEGIQWWVQSVLLPSGHWTACPAVPAVEFMLFLVNQLRGRAHKRTVVGRDDTYPTTCAAAAASVVIGEDSARSSSVYDVLVGSPKNSKEDLRDLNDGREQAVSFWRRHITESVILLVVTLYGKDALGREEDGEDDSTLNRTRNMNRHLDMMSLCISTADVEPLDFVFFSISHEKNRALGATATEVERRESETSWRLCTIVEFFSKMLRDAGRMKYQTSNNENLMCIKEMEELVNAHLIIHPLAIRGVGIVTAEDENSFRLGSDSSSTKTHSRSSSVESKELRRDINDVVAQMAVSSPKLGGPSSDAAFSRSSSSSSVNQQSGGSAQGSPRASPTNSPLSSLPGSPRLAAGVSMVGSGVNGGILPPQSIFPGVTLVSRKKGRTIVVYPNVAGGKTVFVNRIQDVHLYLLAPVRHLTISNCRDVTVFVSAVSSIIHMRACDRVVLIAACGRFSATRCNGIRAYLFTHTRPVLCYGSAAVGEDVATRNTDVVFAPHNAAGFPWANEHLCSAHIDTSTHKNNFWDRPLVAWPAPIIDPSINDFDLSTTSSSSLMDGTEETDDETGGHPYELLPPTDFYTFHVPFVALPPEQVFGNKSPPNHTKPNGDDVHLDARTLSIPVSSDPVPPPPCPAPPDYEFVAKSREMIVPAYRAALKAASQVSPESVVQLNPLIETAFRGWMCGEKNHQRWDQVSQIIELRKNYEKRRAVVVGRGFLE